MKKLLSSLFILAALLITVWGLAGWFLGEKAEQEFKAYLQQSAQLVGKKLFRAELLHYKKNLIGAKARLLISSDFPLLSERIGEFELDVKLLNGPVFFTKSGISVGSSHWVLSIAKNPLAEGETETLKEFSPDGFPTAIIRVDFEKKAHYQSELQTAFSNALITGIFDLETEDNRGAVTLNAFNYAVPPNGISAGAITFSYQHQKAITTNYKPGTASLKISDLQINHKKLPKPLLVSLKANSNISFNDESLNGFIKAVISNKSADNYPFDTAEISLLFNGLSSNGFIAFNEANAELENLKQQVEWVLEEAGELPEGQDQIWALYDRIEQLTKKLPKTLAALGDNSQLQIKIASDYQGAKSYLNGKIKLTTDNPTITSWLALLDGEAKVKLDNSLYGMLKQLLPLKSRDFTLQLKRNKVLMLQ